MSMYILATAIFIIGTASGGIYGYMTQQEPLGMIISIIGGGFAGSAAGGLVFTWLYFTSGNETDEDTGETGLVPAATPAGSLEPAHSDPGQKMAEETRFQRLANKINLLKNPKRD